MKNRSLVGAAAVAIVLSSIAGSLSVIFDLQFSNGEEKQEPQSEKRALHTHCVNHFRDACELEFEQNKERAQR